MTALTFDHQSQTSGRHYRLTPVLNTRNATVIKYRSKSDTMLGVSNTLSRIHS